MSIRCPRKLAALILALSMLPLPALAETPAVTTGAGYKKMVEQVGALYREKSGKPLTEMYGGAIGPILEQIKAGSGASVVVSDKATLEASDVPFASFQPLGEDVLVLAWKKVIDIKSVDDLRTPAVQSIGYPDKQTAIYGKAAFSLLNKSGMYKELEPKLSMLSTVPQVFSYLLTGDLDAGFVNLAVVNQQSDAVGGWMEVKDGYDPLFLVAGVVKGHENDPDVQAFVNFLGTDEAKAVYAKHGLR